jgi:diphosphomevalonate decarboxylase
MIRASARAAPNFALVKYWGKADDEAMIPATPSLSITLDGPLVSLSISEPEGPARRDEVELDGDPVPEPWRARTERFLDLVRDRAGGGPRAVVRATGGPPPASGLASSAAYFAALAMAASRAYGLALDPESVSDLARNGSVSAARSVPGGFVVLDPAALSGGKLAASTLLPAAHWNLAVVVAVVDPGMKEMGSSEAMRLTRDTSPFYRAWTGGVRDDFDAAARAARERDIRELGRIAESNCLRMHASAMAARPPVLYLAPGTLAAMARTRKLRDDGIPCFFTVDAGPQVKVVCRQEDVERVREGMQAAPGVQGILTQQPGPGSLFSSDRDAT